jgi:hypothetical protein
MSSIGKDKPPNKKPPFATIKKMQYSVSNGKKK